MQLLSSELQCLIAELSSPKSLAALARTHSTYQRVAEKVLYTALHIYADKDKSLKCMKTLASNSEKASLVHFLAIEYACININKNWREMTYLSKSIFNMHSLSDFRVRSWPGGVDAQWEFIKGLGNILWSVCKDLIFRKLMILLAIQSRSFLITNFLLPWLTQLTLSTFFKSLRLTSNCRYLDYILTIQETS